MSKEKHHCGSCEHFIPFHTGYQNYFYHLMQYLYHIDHNLYQMMHDAKWAWSTYLETQRCKAHSKTYWNFITGDHITYERCDKYNEDGLCSKWELKEEPKLEKPKRWWKR